MQAEIIPLEPDPGNAGAGKIEYLKCFESFDYETFIFDVSGHVRVLGVIVQSI
jgi:hypothetical protein